MKPDTPIKLAPNVVRLEIRITSADEQTSGWSMIEMTPEAYATLSAHDAAIRVLEPAYAKAKQVCNPCR